MSAFAMCAGALVATTAVTSLPVGIAAASGPCEGNLVTNGDFEDVPGGPDVMFDEDIGAATGWGPIWTRPTNGSTGDVFGPGAWGGTKEPTPASGNYAGFWVDSSPTQLLYREGVMNTLHNPLKDKSGSTTLTFTTSQVFPENATLSVYGVSGATAAGPAAAPTGPEAPKNTGLTWAGPGKVDKLGQVSLVNTEGAARKAQSVTIDTTSLSGPVDRIFFTRDDVVGSGKAYITLDDVCLPVPIAPGLVCPGNLVANGDFENVPGGPDVKFDEDIGAATGWGPIWTKPAAGSTGDVFGPGAWGGSKEPTPASGNYAGFWVDSSPTQLLYREGVMNTLLNPLAKGPGSTTLTFTTSQVFPENATLSVYGVSGAAAGPAAAPTDPITPTNANLFAPGKVDKLGQVSLVNTEGAARKAQSISVDTSKLSGPVDRIFFTRDDVVGSGKAYVTLDNVCMPVPIPTSTFVCSGNLVANGDFEKVTGNPDAVKDEDIKVADGWGPIWTKPAAGSTGDVFGPGAWGGSKEPTPASGNYAGFWVDSSPTQLLYREGVMNTLLNPLMNNSGTATLTFKTSQVFIDNATLSVYGVSGAGPAGPSAAPTGSEAPKNTGLVWAGKNSTIDKLGEVALVNTEGAARKAQSISVDTSKLSGPVDRIFFTRDDVMGSGKAYITLDDVCLTAPAAPVVTPLRAPARLMDTRTNGVTVDGKSQGEGALGSAGNNPFGNRTYRLVAGGRADIPTDASAVALNVTAVSPSGVGFLTMFPCNGVTPTPPTTAALNFSSFTTTIGNNVQVGLDKGDVCVFASANTHVIVDVAAYYPGLSSYKPISPQRFADTRPAASPSDVITGGLVGGGPAQAVSTIKLDVAGLGGVPVDVAAVSLNLAAIQPTTSGFAKVYPCDQTEPLAASLNFAPNANVSNGVTIGVAQTSDPATDGKICIVTNQPANLAVDVTGYYANGSAYNATTPSRIVETRVGAGFTTIDGQVQGIGDVKAGQPLSVQVTGRAAVPAGAVGAVLNVAVVQPTGAVGGFANATFATVYPGPCTAQIPTVASVNVSAGDIARSNGVITGLSTSGEICVFAQADMHVVIDLTGYIAA